MIPLLHTIGDAAARRMFRAAVIDGVDQLADNVRLLNMRGHDLRGVNWKPGQKVQLRIEGFTTRTFTPIEWDTDAGSTSVIAAMHGGGPGATYVDQARSGQTCQFFGPRSSIDLTSIGGPALLVGDDTSIGLAAASKAVAGLVTDRIFETSTPERTRLILDALDIGQATLVDRDAEGELQRAVLDAVQRQPTITVVLTGRAQSIRKIRNAMKQSRVHQGRTIVHSYWDENRTGLD